MDPRLLVDVAQSSMQKTSALVAGELMLSGSHVNVAVLPVCLCKLQGRASPTVKDVLTRVKKIQLTFPRRLEDAFPLRLLKNGDDSAPVLY